MAAFTGLRELCMRIVSGWYIGQEAIRSKPCAFSEWIAVLLRDENGDVVWRDVREENIEGRNYGS